MQIETLTWIHNGMMQVWDVESRDSWALGNALTQLEENRTSGNTPGRVSDTMAVLK